MLCTPYGSTVQVRLSTEQRLLENDNLHLQACSQSSWCHRPPAQTCRRYTYPCSYHCCLYTHVVPSYCHISPGTSPFLQHSQCSLVLRRPYLWESGRRH